MYICGHTMVKNEYRWLWYSVTSVIDYVDKLLLWDMGSTDGTIEIIEALIKKFPDKIIYKKIDQSSPSEFTKVRQQMLDATNADWILMVDGDEIWWKDSIVKMVDFLRSGAEGGESVYVPTVNTVGDIFHYQSKSAGRYKFGKRLGHFNLRAVSTKIPGLHSKGIHGIWGWADGYGEMVQDREEKKVKFLDTPYLHCTFLPRASTKILDEVVVKRKKKMKYEIGISFPNDFYYPESLFSDTPIELLSPWFSTTVYFRLRAYIETPLRNLKRILWTGSPGY